MSASRYQPQTAFGRAVNTFEETAIAVILGLMTLITFVNVIFRYVFNSPFGFWLEGLFNVDFPGSVIWGLEATSILFAWLVLFGVSYCVKVTAHLGVDAVINLFNKRGRWFLAVLSGICCLVYAFLMLKGAWDYWANFANLPQTTGRWFPLGFQDKFLGKSWYEVVDIPMPEFLRFMEGWLNEGEVYEKLPRVIPYIMLPIGAALLFFRFAQATWGVVTGRRDSLIVSHEAEEAIEDLAAARAEQEG